jgi:hypothetical protein
VGNVSGTGTGKRKMMFRDLYEFIREIFSRFKIISLELKIKFDNATLMNENNNEENENLTEKINNNQENSNFDHTNHFLKFVEYFIEENLEFLRNFTYSYISFNFEQDSLNSTKTNHIILSHFQKILLEKNLTNVTLAHHISYKLPNIKTHLEDSFDYYDYVHYDKNYADKIWNRILLIKEKEIFGEFYKRKVLLDNLLRNMFDYSRIYKWGRLDYSTELVKNKKIVPFEVGVNNVMVFTN